jgi:hypothetical protein
MSINLGPINNSNIEGINSETKIDGAKKTSLFAGMKISAASADSKKATMEMGSNVQQHSLDKTQETNKTEDVQATQKTSGTGMFGKFKIGAGKPPSPPTIQNTLSSAPNVHSSTSLEGRVNNDNT